MAELNIQNLKLALKKEFNTLRELIKPLDIINHLWSHNMIELDDKEELKQIHTNKGETHCADKLLTMIQANRTKAVEEFMNVLKIKQPEIFNVIKEAASNINTVDEIAAKLRDEYQSNKKWYRREVVPGEENPHVDVNNEDILMTPVFNAHKARKGQFTTEPMYKQLKEVSLAHIVGHLNSNQKEDQSEKVVEHLMFLEGDPGTGKTTAMHNIAWQWVKQTNTQMSNFTHVFLLPVREINEPHLIRVLSKDLHLIEPDQTECLDMYLSSDKASTCLFILDGIDEREFKSDHEIFKLIKGELYPAASVVVTGRSGARGLQVLEEKFPLIKVQLKGTDEESRDRFLTQTLAMSDIKDYRSILAACKKKMSDLSLLLIPLYLALTSFILQDEWATTMTPTGIVPETTTELFNAFCYVLVKKWMVRLKLTSLPSVRFKISPLNETSGVPLPIQKDLYQLCRMCYKALKAHEYEFSERDANQHYISMEVIRNSGFFSLGISGLDGCKTDKSSPLLSSSTSQSVLFFCKHKQIQEYLSGLYLAGEKFDAPGFKDIFMEHNGKARNLLQLMTDNNMARVLPFACGFSLQSFIELLPTIRFFMKTPAERPNPLHRYYCLYYEASLLFETKSPNDEECHAKFLEFLRSASTYVTKFKFDRRTSPGLISSQNEKRLQQFTSKLSETEAHDLLDKFYGLNVDSDDPKRSLSLDQFQSDLLAKCKFPKVRILEAGCEHRTYIDLSALLHTFGQLESLEVCTQDYFVYNRTDSPCVGSELGSRLTKLSLYCDDTPVKLPKDEVLCIMSLPRLKHLCVYNVDMFTCIGDMVPASQVKCSSLEEMYIHGAFSTACAVSGLCTLLTQSAPTLKTLNLRIDEMPLKCLDNVSARLRKLARLTRLYVDLDTLTMDLLKPTGPLHRLKGLKSLRLSVQRVKGCEGSLISVLSQSKSLTEVILWDFYSQYTEYKFPGVFKDKAIQFEVRVKIPEATSNVEVLKSL